MTNQQAGLSVLLQQLDEWRHFAAYKLEQRVDPLIGMRLPSILQECLPMNGEVVNEIVIPEFPLPYEALRRSPSRQNEAKVSYRCDRIDFVAFSESESIRSKSCISLN